jgi:hypothetical protein
VVTRLLATAEADGIQFSVIFKHRFPGDRPVYEPFTVGGFAIVLDIDPSPPFNVSTGDHRRLWVLPAEDALQLRETSLYGSEERGAIPIDSRPRRIEFRVPYAALRDDDGLVSYRLNVYAVTGADESGVIRVLTDTYSGDTLPGL